MGGGAPILSRMPARVLVVEDDNDFQQILTGVLGEAGYKTALAPTAEEGWKAFSSQGADLVLLDLQLPDGDGVELCRRIRAKDARVPILMCTIRSQLEQVAKALSCGANDYVVKPFEQEDLLERVAAALEA